MSTRDRITTTVAVGLIAAVFAFSGTSVAQQDEVTDEMIALGQQLYAGDAGCAACHGPSGEGMPGMTADLTDGEWTNVEGGTVESIAKVISEGLSAEQTGGIPMPPAASLDAAKIKAVAAYVWSVNQPGE